MEVSVLVEYEWRPNICSVCKGIGHMSGKCRKAGVSSAPGPAPTHVPAKPVQVWRPVVRPRPVITQKGKALMQVTVVNPVSHALKFGGPTYHDSSVLVPDSPIIQMVRQEHNSPLTTSKTYAESVFHVTQIACSVQQITAEVTELETGAVFWFTVVYVFNDEDDKRSLWTKLQHIKDMNSWISKLRGAFFTWNNKQYPSTRVFSRINRCMVTEDWIHQYPDSYAYFMNEGLFDHTPVICYRRKNCQIRKTSFRNFNMWGLDENFKSIVKREWDTPISGISMFQVITKLRNLKKPLKELNKNRYSDIEKATKVARQQLDELQTQMHRQPDDPLIIEAEKAAAKTFYGLQKAMFSFLQQKAKTKWLKEGDENTAYYHRKIKARQVHNKVLQIKDMHGTTQTYPKDIEKAFLEFYMDLLGTSKAVKSVHVPTVRTCNMVSDQHTIELLRPVSIEEVKHCFSSIPSTKSPGPDGYSSQFFNDSWEKVGQDIFDAMNNFFHTGKILKQINSTNITLIPKNTNPGSVIEFRPIACCNTIYKCIAKLLCSRLGKGSRGLSQGDPLSPLLFTLCMEFLPRILHVIGQHQDFKFYPLCGSLRLNHLLFADDLLMFSRGDECYIVWLLRAFSIFSVSSALCLNKEKSNIYFNGMCQGSIDNILQVSGFLRGKLPFRYLGMPISSKKLTKNEGMKLIDKITARIRSWGAKHLSYSGRLVLELYLGGNDTYMKTPNVKWESCCTPKDEDGKWLGEDKEYTVAGGYEWLRAPQPKISWRYTCQNSMNIPRTSFIFWAAVKERLLTKDRLVKMRYGVDTTCFLCGTAQESHKHLFYDCCFSEYCIHLWQQQLQITFPARELSSWFSKHHGISKLQKKLMCSGQVVVVYAIWKARNKARVDQVVIQPLALMKHVLKEVLSRFWSKNAADTQKTIVMYIGV
ncbi:uncharacterized protein LOC141629742 [Silene latifolia]|uniref:uncharacterized protein LOC141629742 n=1 Tax=Silene latifolia TaxID=37657 RepID=UPI003D76A583